MVYICYNKASSIVQFFNNRLYDEEMAGNVVIVWQDNCHIVDKIAFNARKLFLI